MNPHKQNKLDISKLSADEQRLFRLYGKLPTKKDVLQNKLKERKYFDSGDYALSKAGKASDIGVTQIGREHPVPEKIPHSAQHPHPLRTQAHNTVNGNVIGTQTAANVSPPGQSSFPAGSPVKECSILHQETTAEQLEKDSGGKDDINDLQDQKSAPSSEPLGNKV